MTRITLEFLIFTGLVALLLTLTAWSVRALRLRVGIAVLGLALLPTGYVAALDLLGRPRPIEMTRLAATEDPEVLGAKSVEGDAIYLLVDAPDWDAPRHLVLPWDAKLAQQLQDAREAAAADGSRLRMRSAPQQDETEPIFYPEPQPLLPLKVV